MSKELHLDRSIPASVCNGKQNMGLHFFSCLAEFCWQYFTYLQYTANKQSLIQLLAQHKQLCLQADNSISLSITQIYTLRQTHTQ